MVFWQKWKEKLTEWLLANKHDQDDKDFQKNSPDFPPEQHFTVIPSNPLPYEVLETYSGSRFWNDTERIKGYQSHLGQETFIPEIECQDEEINRCFGSSQPSSTDVLLHHLAGSVHGDQSSIPILMVHGAGHHANLAWCESQKKESGLLTALTITGRDLFAVTFAHPHGDNWQQAIQLGNIIHRIKERTKTDRIDLIAHSKGGIPAWIYLANLCETDGAPYRGDVARYIMLGTPNRGIDFPFRHAHPNWAVVKMGINAPIACDSMLYYGRYIDTTERSIYRDSRAFVGSSQLLFRWDEQFPVSSQAKTLYYGGQNLLLHSRGIDAAIRDGNHLMETLLQSPVDLNIDLHLLAGNHAYFHGVPGEQDGPSDGLVFVESVLYTDGIATHSSQIKAKDVLPLNHLDLLYHPDAHEWVLKQLQR